MLTGLINGLGVSVGSLEDFDPPSPENPSGFWEHIEVRKANESLLASVGCEWDKVVGWQGEEIEQSVFEYFEQSARTIIKKIDDQAPWVIKDPRLCLTAKYWASLLRAPRFVWIVRDPLEVAISLRQRNDFPIDVGLALWEVYNQSVVDFLGRNSQIHLVDYVDVIESPEEELTKLREWLQEQDKEHKINATERLQEFIDPSLYRSKFKSELEVELGARSHPSLNLYEAIRTGKVESAIGRETSKESLDSLVRHEQVQKQVLYKIGRQLEYPKNNAFGPDRDLRFQFELEKNSLRSVRRKNRNLKLAVEQTEELLLSICESFTLMIQSPVDVNVTALNKISNPIQDELKVHSSLKSRAQSAAHAVQKGIHSLQTGLASSQAEIAAMKQAESQLSDSLQELLISSESMVTREATELDLNKLLKSSSETRGKNLQGRSDIASTVEELEDSSLLLSECLDSLREQRDKALSEICDNRQRVKLVELDLNAAKERTTRLSQNLLALEAQHEGFKSQISSLLESERSHIAKKDVLVSKVKAQAQALNQIAEAFSALTHSWRWRLGNIAVDVVDRLRFKSRVELASDYIQNVLSQVLSESVSAVTLIESGHDLKDTCPNLNLSVKGWKSASLVISGLYPKQYNQWEIENEAANNRFPELERSWQASRPQVMIGTLCSGENEFDSCKSAVNRQSYRQIEHHIIQGLPNKEAHDRLYKDFLKSECDFLVKIDADMVIVDESFIERVVNILVARPEIGILQMAILDYYSGGEIQGVNAYSKRMQWDHNKQNALFTDSTQTPSNQRLVVWGTFMRSVIHSPNPHLFQAFHFGVHRALKVLHGLTTDSHDRAAEQMAYLERTYQHYEIRRTSNLLVACLGAEFAFRGKFTVNDIDYTSNRLIEFFNIVNAKPVTELELELNRLRREPVSEHKGLELLRRERHRISKRKKLQRLLMVLPHFKIFGGVNRFFEIARQAKEQGIEVYVAALSVSTDQMDRVSRDFPGVQTCSIEQAMEAQWDCVLCGDFSSTLMTILPLFDSELTAVYLLNGWQHRHLNNVQIDLANPDLVIANSSYAASQYPEWAPALIPGAIDLTVFSSENPAIKLPNHPLRVCIPGGRDKPRKRFKDALEACKILHNKGFQLEVHVLDAQQYEVKAGFPTAVHSKLNRAQVAELLRTMHVLVCPEEDAGWNNPAAEGMACGVPVVCTQAGTTDFAFDEETALVVPPRNPKKIADAVERLILDHDLSKRLAAAGQQAIQPFTWAALTRKLIDVLESCRFDPAGRAARNLRARKNIVRMIERTK